MKIIKEKNKGYIKYINSFDGTVELHDMEVYPEYRKQGIGTKLLKRLEKESKANVIFLFTRLNNDRARKFYENFEYKIVCRLPNFYIKNRWNSRDALMYIKYVKNRNNR